MIVTLFDTKQLGINGNRLDTSDTDGNSDIEEKGNWFWNESTNEDTDDDGYSDVEESDLGPGGVTEEATPQKSPKEIHI